jgi:hypothetical protein
MPEVGYPGFQDPLRQILPRGNKRELAQRLADDLVLFLSNQTE